MKSKPLRHSLRVKMYLQTIGIILAMAAGLMSISYYVFCQRADDRCNALLVRGATASAESIYPEFAAYFMDALQSEDFAEVSARARAAGDEGIIRAWLESRPSWFEQETLSAEESPQTIDVAPEAPEEPWTLLDDYDILCDQLSGVMELVGVDAAYLQVDIDGITYNIADPDTDLFYLWTVEEPIAEFEDIPDNTRIAPTVYRSQFGWLITAMEPIVNPETGETVCMAGVDINMTDVVRERYDFLVNCIIFVALLTAAAGAVSVLLVDRSATRPLMKLASAATDFAAGDEACTRDDIIDLDIRSKDEIGILYQEIRSMQERIVDYTENITAITAERERVRTELDTASRIQASMLPDAVPNRKEFDLSACMTPAKAVGGDFYDFFLIDDDHLCLVIADVSDKGVPAALFMMSSKILLSYRARLGGSPGEILTAVNRELCRENSSGMFVTVWLGILDLRTGLLCCSSAGHEYPMLRDSDGVFRIYKDPHGLVLGARRRSAYRDYEIQLSPGGTVFVYTDGVPEANNEDGSFYGMARLEETLNRASAGAPEEILKTVRADVDAFAGAARQFDDLTMLCVTWRGP